MTSMTVRTADREVAAGRLEHITGHTYRACNHRLSAEADDMLHRAQAKRDAANKKRRDATRSWVA